MPDPLVSVVLATHRVLATLPAILQTVVGQTLEAIELIVVDDGCPDRARLQAVIEEHAPSARLLHQARSGVARARNHGASVASGRYLAFLDDDDLWEPTRCAAQVAAFEREPEAVLAYCRLASIDEQGRRIATGDQVAVRSRSAVVRRDVGILMPNVMIRSDAFRRVGGFHTRVRLVEDHDLILRLALEGPFAFVDEELVSYRAHADNGSSRHREVARWLRRVGRLHLARAKDDGDAELVADLRANLASTRRYAAWATARSARSHLRHRRVGPAAAELAWLLGFAPQAPVDWLIKRVRGARSAAPAAPAAPVAPVAPAAPRTDHSASPPGAT